jgi:hypothetical protein
MATVNDFFPSNYLRAADLKGRQRIVTIDRVATDVFENDGKKQKKPVLHFKEEETKPLVTNKTNFLLIQDICGENTDDWHGKKIVLVPEPVSFRGTVNDAVRVKRVKPPLKDELNDEITI